MHKITKKQFQCIDSIYIDTPNNLWALKRTRPRKNEKFKLYSSGISFMTKDDPRRAQFYYPDTRDCCVDRSIPKNIRIEYLNFAFFYQDSNLYPYYNHDEIEWLTLQAAYGPMELPGILSGHRNLKKLAIYGELDDSVKVPLRENLGVFGKLESLYLNDVPLNDEDIAKLKLLPNLKHLWIEKAGLDRFPMALTEMTKLEALILNDVCIGTLPDELKNLTRLKLLHLEYTGVSPEEAHRIADQMPSVRYLYHDSRADWPKRCKGKSE